MATSTTKARGRPRGRPKKIDVEEEVFHCQHCGKTGGKKDFYNSWSLFHKDRLPMCKDCIGKMYIRYLQMYKENRHNYPEKDAVRRICMAFDVYYCEEAYASALKRQRAKIGEKDLIMAYLAICQLTQYKNKTYDDTIREDGGWSVAKIEPPPETISANTIKFFGQGFSNEDYVFLQDQYDDWVTRHECSSKAQEEIFKQLCYTQLDLLKANQKKEDTKELKLTFQKLLESAKLQPKQNSSETLSDAQTFGTLIDKWENERPIPEVDPELKDVDKIAVYIDTFFRGHLAKMMGLKNGLSNLYTEYMKQYTVEKPEYNSDEDSEALFDAIFGNKILEDE